MPTRKDLCDNACVIARGLILLIGHILFLIEDDAADIPSWCKERRPCADDDPRLAAPYPEDGIVALGERKAAVQNNNISGKPLLKRRDELTRERNFRHEYDHLPPRAPYRTRRLHVDARLAAPCHPMKEIAVKRLRDSARLQRGDGTLLRLRQRLSARLTRPCRIAVTHLPAQVLREDMRIGQMSDGRCRNPCLLQFCERVLARRAKELQCAPLRRPPRECTEQFLRNLTRGIVFLILCLVTPIGPVFLAYKTIAEELFQRPIHIARWQSRPQLCPALLAMRAEAVVNSACCRIHEDGMRFIHILRRYIGGKNTQSALTRHKEPHHLRRRAEIKCRQLLCRCKQLRRKPRLLIHGLENRAQAMSAIASRIVGTYGDDESLDTHLSKRNEDTPSYIDLRQRIRHDIGKRRSNTLNGNVDIDIGNRHAFPFSAKKKPSHEHIRAAAPFLPFV